MLNVAPTKTNLIKLREELKFASLGYELLDQKRSIIIVELLSLVDQAADFQGRVEDALSKAYKTLEKAVSTLEHARFPVEPSRIREIFQHPRVTDDYHLAWRETNVEEIVSFLCSERDFSEDRIRKALKKMEEGSKEAKGKVTLETFFG